MKRTRNLTTVAPLGTNERRRTEENCFASATGPRRSFSDWFSRLGVFASGPRAKVQFAVYGSRFSVRRAYRLRAPHRPTNGKGEERSGFPSPRDPGGERVGGFAIPNRRLREFRQRFGSVSSLRPSFFGPTGLPRTQTLQY